MRTYSIREAFHRRLRPIVGLVMGSVLTVIYSTHLWADDELPTVPPRAGLIQVAKLGAARGSEEAVLFGRVIDPGIFVTPLLDLRSAQSALKASKAELERARALYAAQGNISLRTLEVADATFQKDVAVERGLYTKFQMTFGDSLVTKENEDTLLSDVIAARSTVVQLDSDSEILTSGQLQIRVGSSVRIRERQGNRVNQPEVSQLVAGSVASVSGALDPITKLGSVFVVLRGKPFPFGAEVEGTVTVAMDGDRVLYAVPESAVLFDVPEDEGQSGDESLSPRSEKSLLGRIVVQKVDESHYRKIPVLIVGQETKELLVTPKIPAELRPDIELVVAGAPFALSVGKAPLAEE